jgi:N,N'-diacetyllegionaminate synthase
MIEIICEAGLEHCGSPGLAYRLIDAAKQAGADVVKFQTFDVDKLLRHDDRERWVLRQFELPKKEFIALSRFAEGLGIEFMSTPGDLDSLKFLVEEVGVKRIKIGSDDLTYRPMLEAAAETILPVILSTGMANMNEINIAVATLRAGARGIMASTPPVTLLHCVSSYPTKPQDANLLAMGELSRCFSLPTGYSDHTQGSVASIAAAALGAIMIEKHLTISDHYMGPDRAVALDPGEFKDMVAAIRDVEQMLGSGKKEPCQAERDNIVKFRKDRDGFRGLLS